MSRHRRAIVFALFLFLVGGHALVQISQCEWWPFSRYPMYSNVFEPRTFSRLKLVTLGDGENWNVSIRHEFWPFWESALMESLALRTAPQEQYRALKALAKWRQTPLRLYQLNYDWPTIVKMASDSDFFQGPAPESSRKLIAEVYPE